MGNKQSKITISRIENTVLERIPGIDPQLHMAFVFHAGDDIKKLDFEHVEMILRHMLMQFGLVDIMFKYCDPNTYSLDFNAISNILGLFGVWAFPGMKVSFHQFRAMAYCWIFTLLHEQIVIETEKQIQEEQEQEKMHKECMDALKEFEEKLAYQLHSQDIQYNSESTVLIGAKEKIELPKSQFRMALEQINQAISSNSTGKGYAYPAQLAPRDSIMSLGAPIPRRRKVIPKNRVKKVPMLC